MAIAIASKTTEALDGTSSNLVLTKPSGLAAGDLLLCVVGIGDNSGQQESLSSPAGWTEPAISINDEYFVAYKIADSSDAAATDFTFSMDGSDSHRRVAVLYRITGAPSDTLSFVADSATDPTPGNDPSATVSIAPIAPDSLFFFGFRSVDNNSGQGNVSNYTVTGGTNPTFTEEFDETTGQNFPCTVALAYGTYDSTTEITAMSLDQTPTDVNTQRFFGFIIAPQSDGTGTHTILQNTATANDSDNTSSTTPTSNQLQMTATAQDATGDAREPTRWSNESRPSTTWTNKTRP